MQIRYNYAISLNSLSKILTDKQSGGRVSWEEVKIYRLGR